jgi:hypothetical protein
MAGVPFARMALSESDNRVVEKSRRRHNKGTPRSLKVDNFNWPPGSGKVFGGEPPVTMLGDRLAAQQTRII